MRYAALILAAGLSCRMEAYKPLLRLCDKSLLARCAELFAGAEISDIVVVTGHRSGEVEKAAAALQIRSVYNPDFPDGMFSSICCGVKSISGVDGFFLLPVDIPLVRAATLASLLERFDGTEVLFPCFAEERGHPPLIPTSFIDEILSFDGEGGLQNLLAKLPCRDIPVWDRAILKDMDNHDDRVNLESYCAKMQTGTSAEALQLASLMMPEKGLRHGRMVASVAGALAEELHANGLVLNRAVICNAALLHDIAKGAPDHELQGADLLRSLGLEDLADCVASHRDIDASRIRTMSEVEVVFLADKLVSGDRLVTVRRRYEEKLDQYAGNTEACWAIKTRMDNGIRIQALMERLCKKSLDQILEDRCSEYKPFA